MEDADCQICGYRAFGETKGLELRILDGEENNKGDFVCWDCNKLFDPKLQKDVVDLLEEYKKERWRNGRDILKYGRREETLKTLELHRYINNAYHYLLAQARVKQYKIETSWYHYFKSWFW